VIHPSKKWRRKSSGPLTAPREDNGDDWESCPIF
jgi:hypothetical protein